MSGDTDIRDLALAWLKQVQAAGETFVFLPEAGKTPATAPQPTQANPAVEAAQAGPADEAARTVEPSEVKQPIASPDTQPQAASTPEESLEAFGKRISGCKLCELHKGRTNFVFGAGDPQADLMFVGEGPGAEEDRQGLPFVGASGQLLTKIIASVGFRREEVYIANMVKCRPPGNRDPLETEIAACNPYLLRQIELIRPKVIVTLGRHSAYFFHGRQDSMRALRSRVVSYNGISVVSTYHPAALLRNPEYKRDTWEDMLLARTEYDRLGGRPSSGEVFRPPKKE
ncbi:uracil-DNA glycosylase [bacterium]|nr:uracil-DNA glycosylase [bacterium]